MLAHECLSAWKLTTGKCLALQSKAFPFLDARVWAVGPVPPAHAPQQPLQVACDERAFQWPTRTRGEDEIAAVPVCTCGEAVNRLRLPTSVQHTDTSVGKESVRLDSSTSGDQLALFAERLKGVLDPHLAGGEVNVRPLQSEDFSDAKSNVTPHVTTPSSRCPSSATSAHWLHPG